MFSVSVTSTVVAGDSCFCLWIALAQVLEQLSTGSAIIGHHQALYDEFAVLEELVGVLHLLEEISVSSVVRMSALNRSSPRALEGACCDRKPVDP